MDVEYWAHKVDQIACEILGHNKVQPKEYKSKKGKFYEWQECSRCHWVLKGTEPPLDTYLIDIYDAESLYAPYKEPSPFYNAIIRNVRDRNL